MSPSGLSKPASTHGLLLALGAYLCWGFFPAFFKTLAHVPPLEVLAHRIFWSAVFLLLLLALRGGLQRIGEVVADRGVLLTLTCTTLLIATNWLVFIYAVASDQVLQSSLGYFITPLVSVLLGFFVLGERLSPPQVASVLLAAGSVLFLALSYGQVPWIALLLAFSFGTYGLLRKQARVDSLLGLCVETLLLAPFALGGLIYLESTGVGYFWGQATSETLLLILCGVVTAVPLLLFTGGARRLRLATVGFLQYLTPTLHLGLAVLFFGEPFTPSHLLAFSGIWLALALYSFEALRVLRRRPLPNPS